MSPDHGVQRRVVVRWLGCSTPLGTDDSSAGSRLFHERREVRSNSFGFGGVKPALVVRRWEV